MSAYATGWALRQRAGKAKLLLVALADLCDEKGETFTDMDTLAEVIEADRVTVYRQLLSLENGGFIERTNRKVKGVQLISKTRLLMAAQAYPVAELQNETRKTENTVQDAIPSELQNATRLPEIPVKTELQNATHKDKFFNSISLNNLNNNNTSYNADMRDVTSAGLLDLWSGWVRLQGLKKPTQEAQIAVWAAWIRDGNAEALRAEAAEVISLGSYAHPFAGLKSRMGKALSLKNTSFSLVPAAPRPVFRPGQRVRYPDGSEAEVLAVLSAGIATDHPTLPDVPLSQLATLEVLG